MVARAVAAALYSIFILHQTTTYIAVEEYTNELYSIFILHQTTTSESVKSIGCELYSIFILHQTTTASADNLSGSTLYSIFILHQTTTVVFLAAPSQNCILSLFYIKPQPYFLHIFRNGHCILSLFYIKPQLKNSSSVKLPKLYSIFILHQTTTLW